MKIKRFGEDINEGKKKEMSLEELKADMSQIEDTIKRFEEKMKNEKGAELATSGEILKTAKIVKGFLERAIKRYTEEVTESINEEVDEYGVVNIHIDGQGFIYGATIDGIRKVLNNLIGERHLFTNGKEVNPYQSGGNGGGDFGGR